MKSALVVCIGNTLVADDAFGCAVYDALTARHLPDDVRLVQLGLGGIRLLDIVAGEPILVVVDAVRMGVPPGTLHLLDWRDLKATQGDPVVSHDIGLGDAIQIGYQLLPDKMPRRIHLVGAEGACFDQLGAPLTPAVAAAIPAAVKAVCELLPKQT